MAKQQLASTQGQIAESNINFDAFPVEPGSSGIVKVIPIINNIYGILSPAKPGIRYLIINQSL